MEQKRIENENDSETEEKILVTPTEEALEDLLSIIPQESLKLLPTVNMNVNMTSFDLMLPPYYRVYGQHNAFSLFLNVWKLHGGKGDLKSMNFCETNRYKWDYVAEIFVDLQDLHSNDEIPGIINDINR